ARRFHLDHVGAEIAEILGRERSHQHGGEIDNLDTFQRPHLVPFLPWSIPVPPHSGYRLPGRSVCGSTYFPTIASGPASRSGRRRHRCKEFPGVFVLRVLENLVHLALLDDPALA